MFIINRKRVKITTKVDLELKEIFESFQIIHGKGFHDALDGGIKIILKENEIIEGVNYELRELDDKRDRLIALEAKLKDIGQVLTKVEREKLSREEELEKERLKALKTLLKKPYNVWTAPNRSHAREVGKFKNNEELKIWVLGRQ